MTIAFLIKWIKEKDFTHIYKAAGLAIIAGSLGLAVNAPMLVSTYEYGKESIRGGSALVTKDSKTTATGLNKDYALSYSMFKSEPLVMMFPNIYGGSSDPNVMDPAKSKAVETLQTMDPQIAQQLQSFVQFYWGGIGGTSGPPYVGILICFFAIMGFSVKSNTHRYWIAATILFTLMLAAGSYFISFNSLMLDHFPFYNKFRAPSMIIVVPTLLIGMMSLYGMDSVLKVTNMKDLFAKYKPSLIILGLVFVAVLYVYMSSDFRSDNDKQLLTSIAQLPDPNQKAAFQTPANDLINAIATDRKTLIESDIVHAVVYLMLVFGLLLLAFKKVLSEKIAVIVFGVIALFDLFNLNVKYLKAGQFVEQSENENAFALSPTDIAIKKDTSNFRILDLRNGIGGAFNSGALVAYHHKTVGGYNPAKLSIYQDLIENQWYKFPKCMPTANMLNTKYFITGNLANDTIANKEALGNVWFVKGIRYEKDAASVMKALDNFNPKDTAIVEEKDKIASLNNIGQDSLSTIQLISNNNDDLLYKSNASKEQLAVFSEIYYAKGWKAYVDNKETPIVKVNYVLRGLVVPAGKHEIKFELKPASVIQSKQASSVASFLIWGMLAFTAFTWFRKQKNSQA
jgi:hypothetical protein